MKIKTALTILLIITLVLMFFGYLFYSGRSGVEEQPNYSDKKPVNVIEQAPATSTIENTQEEDAEKAISEQRRTEIMDSLKAQIASDTPEEDPKVKEKTIEAMKKMLLK